MQTTRVEVRSAFIHSDISFILKVTVNKAYATLFAEKNLCK